MADETILDLRGRELYRSLFILLTTIALAILAYLVLPSDMEEPARRAVAIFIIAAIFWATEVIPLYATSLLVICLKILLLSPPLGFTNISPDIFLRPFSSSVIVLFLGGLLLAAAVRKHGLDLIIAARILRPFSQRPVVLIFAVLILSAVLSMWMSNTATAAMMLAIMAPILRNSGPSGKYYIGLILAVPFGANLGGIGTPIGTPPNAIALAALREAGIGISFLQWMLMTVPLVALLLAITGAMLYWFYPADADTKLPDIKTAPRMNRKGMLTLVVMLITIVLWLTGEWHKFSDGTVALFAGAMLTCLGLLDRKDVDSIDWNILILMWGGLSLGQAMQSTGLVNYIVSLPIAELQGLLLAGVVVLLAVGFSTFMSNTAAANLIVPVGLALSLTEHGFLAILAALACSFAMALPISTPPNALAFATGKVSAAAMMKVGTLVSVISFIVVMAGYQVVFGLLLR